MITGTCDNAHMKKHAELLADAVVHRRGELGWTQKQLADHASISVDTVQAVESARRTGYSAVVKRSLETALGWPPGSIAQCLTDGTTPTPVGTQVTLTAREEGSVLDSPLFRELMSAGSAELTELANAVGEDAGDPKIGIAFAMTVLRLQQEMTRKSVR